MPDRKRAPRKKLPQELAVIDADRCTGCQACLEICPGDCIVLVPSPPQGQRRASLCEIDGDRCVGCRLCLRIPGRKGDPYQLRVCPWEAISMVRVSPAPEAVAELRGPPL
jgi:Na+-translocating ferredoxin:NAD+ oxidoreductase subunit B